MLTSRTDKELSGRWERWRNTGLFRSIGLPSTGMFSKEDLEITIEGNGYYDFLSYMVSTTPADGFSIPKPLTIDVRQRPECGD